MARVDEYSPEEFKKIIEESSSIAQACLKIGYSSKSSSNYNMIRKRMSELNIEKKWDNGHRFEGRVERSPENIFIKESTAHQKTLRKYFLQGEYVPYKCSLCGQEPSWQGQPLSLILDHINGHNHDDRLENLRWVCPNCNSQLPTTGVRNIKNLKNS